MKPYQLIKLTPFPAKSCVFDYFPEQLPDRSIASAAISVDPLSAVSPEDTCAIAIPRVSLQPDSTDQQPSAPI